MKSKILIPGWKTGDNSFGVTAAYMEFLSNFGEVIIHSPGMSYMTVDLVVLPGGKDILPTRYNKIPGYYNSNTDQLLETFDIQMLPKYIDSKTPVFGICRGLQALNVHFGGTLHQNWNHEYSTERNDLVHKVNFTGDGLIYSTMIQKYKRKLKSMKVNSMHHQGIETLGDDLIVTAKHDDGLVEAIEHKELPVIGVQFHPEEIYDTYSIEAITLLLQSSKVGATISTQS